MQHYYYHYHYDYYYYHHPNTLQKRSLFHALRNDMHFGRFWFLNTMDYEFQ